jgi:hypothetical protein
VLGYLLQTSEKLAFALPFAKTGSTQDEKKSTITLLCSVVLQNGCISKIC